MPNVKIAFIILLFISIGIDWPGLIIKEVPKNPELKYNGLHQFTGYSTPIDMTHIPEKFIGRSEPKQKKYKVKTGKKYEMCKKY